MEKKVGEQYNMINKKIILISVFSLLAIFLLLPNVEAANYNVNIFETWNSSFSTHHRWINQSDGGGNTTIKVLGGLNTSQAYFGTTNRTIVAVRKDSAIATLVVNSSNTLFPNLRTYRLNITFDKIQLNLTKPGSGRGCAKLAIFSTSNLTAHYSDNYTGTLPTIVTSTVANNKVNYTCDDDDSSQQIANLTIYTFPGKNYVNVSLGNGVAFSKSVSALSTTESWFIGAIAYGRSTGPARVVFSKVTIYNYNVTDSTAPYVTSPLPSSANYTITQNVMISANVVDNFTISSVKANVTYPGGKIVPLTLKINGAGPMYNATYKINATAGRYNVSFYAKDASGNKNYTIKTYFFGNNMSIKRISPNISGVAMNIGWNKNNVSRQINGSIDTNLTFTVTGFLSDVKSLTIKWFINNNLQRTVTTISNVSNTFSQLFNLDGKYNITARVNTSVLSVNDTFTWYYNYTAPIIHGGGGGGAPVEEPLLTTELPDVITEEYVQEQIDLTQTFTELISLPTEVLTKLTPDQVTELVSRLSLTVPELIQLFTEINPPTQVLLMTQPEGSGGGGGGGGFSEDQKDAIRSATCIAGDNFCPGYCTVEEDSDCAAVCGNGVEEEGENFINCPRDSSFDLTKLPQLFATSNFLKFLFLAVIVSGVYLTISKDKRKKNLR